MAMRWIQKLLLLVVLLSLVSCEEIKKAYHDTFREGESTTPYTRKRTREKQLEEQARQLEEQKQKEDEATFQRIKSEKNQFYNELVDSQFSTLPQVERDTIKAIIFRYITKDDRNEIFKLENIKKWKKEIPLLLQPQKLDEIQEKFYNFLHSEDIIISKNIYIRNNEVRINAYNPTKTDELDVYEYNVETDEWQKMEPVKNIIAKDKILLSEIRLSAAHKVMKSALQHLSKVEGGELPDYLFFYVDNKKWSISFLKSYRKDYRLEANKEGELIKITPR